jgi:hypothetical protein
MVKSWDAGLSHNVKNGNAFERLEKSKYLGTTLTYQNCVQEEIKNKSKSRNACYYSVQRVVSSSLLYKNSKMKIFGNIILPVDLRGCWTWSLTLRETHRLRVFENRVLRRIFGLRRTRLQGIGENCITKSLVICTPHPKWFEWLNREEWDRRGM